MGLTEPVIFTHVWLCDLLEAAFFGLVCKCSGSQKENNPAQIGETFQTDQSSTDSVYCAVLCQLDSLLNNAFVTIATTSYLASSYCEWSVGVECFNNSQQKQVEAVLRLVVGLAALLQHIQSPWPGFSRLSTHNKSFTLEILKSPSSFTFKALKWLYLNSNNVSYGFLQ